MSACVFDDTLPAALCKKLQGTWDSMALNPTPRNRQPPGQDLLVRAVVRLMLLLTSGNRPEYGFKPLLSLATSAHPSLLMSLQNYQECIPPARFDVEVEISTFSVISHTLSIGWTCRALALEILFESISRNNETDRRLLMSNRAVGSLLHGVEKMLHVWRNGDDYLSFPLVYFNSTLTIYSALLALRPVEEVIQSPDLSLWLKIIRLASDDLSVS